MGIDADPSAWQRCTVIYIYIYVVALVQDLAALNREEYKQHPRDTNKEKVDASPVHMKGCLPNLGVLLAYQGSSGMNSNSACQSAIEILCFTFTSLSSRFIPGWLVS